MRKIKVLTAAGARRIDERARKVYGIPTLILMENAGRAVAEEAIRLNKKRVAIFCGKGNNGGDGFVCARHLISAGINTDIFLCSKIHEVKGEARINLDILMKLKKRIIEVSHNDIILVEKNICNYNLIVDAIFGVGLKGKLEGFFKELIQLINSSGIYVIAIDIPSGLNSDTGKTSGPSIKADLVVTFIAKKSGMVKPTGSKYCGRIVVRNIGFPA